MSTFRAIVIGAASFVVTGSALAGEHLFALGALVA